MDKKHTDISNTKCIIIEGQDTGAFWTLEEFSKIYKNGRRTTNKMDWLKEIGASTDVRFGNNPLISISETINKEDQ